MSFRGDFSLFVKPWKHLSLREVAQFAAELGVTGIELPVRPGFAVTPENASVELPIAQALFKDHGLKIRSVAGPIDPVLIEAAGEAGVELLRTMPAIEPGERYLAAEMRWRRVYGAVLPILRDAGVRLAVQQHAGAYVSSAAGVRRLVEDFPAEQVGVVWDPAHCAYSGELPAYALDLLHDHLCMVNLKNGIWKEVSPAGAPEKRWTRYWTSGREGLASWSDVARELAHRDWHGHVLHFAEYAEGLDLDRLTREDFHWMQEVFTNAYAGPTPAA